MLNSSPLAGPVLGGTPDIVASEWTTPDPSTPVQGLLPAAATPLTQWISSFGVKLKLAARRFGVMVKLAGLIAPGSVLTATSQPLNGSILATFTRKKIVFPLATFGRLGGLT